MPEASSAYRGGRERISELASDTPDEALSRMVPACPDWTVRDLLAHVVGVAEDFAAGNFENAGSDEWTSSQIARRSEMMLPALVEEWRVISESMEQMLDQIPPGPTSLLIGDLVSHEHDLRGALDRPGARSSEAVWIGLDRYVRWFGKRIKDAGLPSVLVHSRDHDWQAGILEAAVELEGDPFQLLRALTGRRTLEEIASLRWTGDAGPYIELVPTYTPANRSLEEN
jgi:uncharacterized protein (TIGR03083 family)